MTLTQNKGSMNSDEMFTQQQYPRIQDADQRHRDEPPQASWDSHANNQMQSSLP